MAPAQDMVKDAHSGYDTTASQSMGRDAYVYICIQSDAVPQMPHKARKEYTLYKDTIAT